MTKKIGRVFIHSWVTGFEFNLKRALNSHYQRMSAWVEYIFSTNFIAYVIGFVN
jgi:hypothetical protein